MEASASTRSTRPRASGDANNGDLPPHWAFVRLDEVAELVSGGTPSKSRTEWWQGAIPWASPKDLKRHRLRDTEDHISAEGAENGSRIVPSGSLFIVVRGMILAKDVPVALAEVPMAFNQDMKAIIPRSGAADAEFLLYVLQGRKSQLWADIGTSAHGTRRINTSAIAGFPLPLPPLPEQRAIAKVLRAAEQAVAARRREATLERERRAGLMEHLFTRGTRGEAMKESEVGSIPTSWSTVALRDAVEFLQYGTSKKCAADADAIPVLRIPNVVGGEVDIGDLKYVNMDAAEADGLRLREGDLLFVRTNGQREYIGRCSMYRGSPPNSLFASYLIRARLKPVLLPGFVQMYTETARGRAFLSGRASNSADGKFNINTQTIRQVIVPLPSLDEQREIETAIDLITARLTAVEQEERLLEELYRALLDELMTGRLSAAPLIEHGEQP